MDELKHTTRTPEQKETLSKIYRHSIAALERLSDVELREAYMDMHYWGAGDFGVNEADRSLKIMRFELASRENEKSFKKMQRLTYIATAVSGLSAVLTLLQVGLAFISCKGH